MWVKEYLHEFYVFAVGMLAAVILLALAIAVTGLDIFGWIGSLSKADFATLLSGFGGAALGGMVSWLLAKEAGRETLARDEAQRRANERAMALAIILKTQQIANGLFTLKKYFYKSRQRANEAQRLARPMWETTKPVISPTPSRLRYDPAEFAPLIAAKRTDLVDRCNILALRYEVDETIITDYSVRRSAFHDLMGPYSELSGPDGLVTTSVPAAMKNQFLMKGQELEDIIRQLYGNVVEDSREAQALCEELTSAFRKHFGEDVYALISGEEVY